MTLERVRMACLSMPAMLWAVQRSFELPPIGSHVFGDEEAHCPSHCIENIAVASGRSHAKIKRSPRRIGRQGTAGFGGDGH